MSQLGVLVKNENHMCFGCSDQNPIGLKLKFKSDGDICRTEFTAGEVHQGWNGYVHGGLIAAMLDETMAWWLWLRNIPIMTAEMTTRYSLGLPINEKLLVESWCEAEKKGKIYEMAAHILLPDGKVAVRGKAKFMRVEG